MLLRALSIGLVGFIRWYMCLCVVEGLNGLTGLVT